MLNFHNFVELSSPTKKTLKDYLVLIIERQFRQTNICFVDLRNWSDFIVF